jgi:hypothetical protein
MKRFGFRVELIFFERIISLPEKKKLSTKIKIHAQLALEACCSRSRAMMEFQFVVKFSFITFFIDRTCLRAHKWRRKKNIKLKLRQQH